MSPYSSTLAHARLNALQALVQALQDAATPDEKRRCAVAIFNAPEPNELDDTIEFDEDDTANDGESHPDENADFNESDPGSVPTATLDASRATASPADLSGQAAPSCNTTGAVPTGSPRPTLTAREAGERRLPAAQPLENPSTSPIVPDSLLAHEMGERTAPFASPGPCNSFPDYPELAHLTDDQILHASSADLMCLALAAKRSSPSLGAAPAP